MKSTAPVCNLAVLNDDELRDYKRMRTELREAARGFTELPDGYAIELSPEPATLLRAAEFMSYERRCCPFFILELAVQGDGPAWLRLKGDRAAKTLLRDELDIP